MRRKCRRMMAFTEDRLYILKVDDGKAKASYPIKSVQLSPSDKVNPVRIGFFRRTSFACAFLICRSRECFEQIDFYLGRYSWPLEKNVIGLYG